MLSRRTEGESTTEIETKTSKCRTPMDQATEEKATAQPTIISTQCVYLMVVCIQYPLTCFVVISFRLYIQSPTLYIFHN